MNKASRKTGTTRKDRRSRAVLSSSVALASAAAATIGLVGSSAAAPRTSAERPAAARPSGKSYTIALVPGLTTDPFYITMHNGAAAEAKKLGVTLTWQGGPTFSPSTQLPVVNSLLAKHPSALLIAPTDVKALQAPIQRFVSAGIPVIAVDTTIDDTKLLSAGITSNNFQGGEAAADTIAKLHGDKGDVAVINVNPGVSTTDARQAGFLAEMKKYPNMKVVATEYDQDSPTTAEVDAKNLILAHSSLVGIFGTNLYSAQGAGEGVEQAGDKGKISVAGYDAEPAEIALLKKGVINILVIQQPAVEGADAVKYAVDILNGDKSMVPKETLVPNVIATTATASSPMVTKYYYQSTLTNG